MQNHHRTPTRRAFLASLGGGAAAASWLTGCNTTTTAPKPPNFVFFLADDLGVSDLGCYGSKFHETPNIDKLATQGIRFTQAYAACPVCSPTRISIMTGKYPARTGVTNYIPGNQSFPNAPLKAVTNKLQMDPAEVTLAEALKTAGYATACIGKWHLGAGESEADRQGFDLYATRGTRKKPDAAGPTWSGSPNLEGAPEDYITDRFAKTAVKFVQDNKDKPFFLYFAFHNPHIPFDGKAELNAKYESKLKSTGDIAPTGVPNSWPGAAQEHPVYAAMIQSVDEAVATVLKELDTHNLASNTIVVFFSDNGGLTVPESQCQIATSNAPYREGKGHLYEGGVREPLIVRWPNGNVPAGVTCDTPVISTDFYPTFREVAGVASNVGDPKDGISLLPLLRQPSNASAIQREALYWHYPHYANQLGTPGGAIRQGDFKLIEHFAPGSKPQLYNLAEDPGERTDLAAKMPEQTQQLQAKLKSWREQVGAQMPQPNPNHDPKKPWEGLRWYNECPKKTGTA